MRVAAVFFLFLSFLLLRTGFCHSAAQHTKKTLQTELKNTDQGFHVIKNTSLSEKKEDFISIEDDDDLASTRKYVLVVKSFITVAYTSILIDFYNTFKNRLPFCKHLSYTSSYKYILQRVLRL
jgi:hypothetical protein